MSQAFTDDVFSIDHDGPTDLANMEANFAALKSNFSGASAPGNTVAGMSWYHTSKGSRVRNAANTAWLKALQGDASSKTWFYRNDTAEGWLIDSSVTDKVIAIKGGSAAFNVNGGNTAGSWTITGLTASGGGTHNHQWYDYLSDTQSPDKSYNSGGTATALSGGVNKGFSGNGLVFGQDPNMTLSYDYYTSNATPSAPTISHDGSSRPAAAVGTLQYPDLS